MLYHLHSANWVVIMAIVIVAINENKVLVVNWVENAVNLAALVTLVV